MPTQADRMSSTVPKRRAVVIERTRPWTARHGSVPVSRGAMVDALVKELHQSYAYGLKSFIVNVRAKYEGEPDVERKVVDAIWEDPGYKLIGLKGKDSQEITPGDWDDLTSARRDAIQAYIDAAQGLEEQLQSLTDGDLARRYEQYIAAKQTEAAAKRREQGQKADIDAFFNRQAAAADCVHWAIVPVWTAEEATALSFGKDPRHVNVQTLKAYSPTSPSPFRDNFTTRLDLVLRWSLAEKVEDLISPTLFLSWAAACNFEVPAELLQIKQNFGGKNDNRNKDTEIQGNRLHHIYEIILGFAVSRYNLDVTLEPMERQRGVYAPILKDFLSVGIDVNEDTLRDLVRDAMRWASGIGHPMVLRAEKKKVARNKTQSRASKGASRPRPNLGGDQ